MSKQELQFQFVCENSMACNLLTIKRLLQES